MNLVKNKPYETGLFNIKTILLELACDRFFNISLIKFRMLILEFSGLKMENKRQNRQQIHLPYRNSFLSHNGKGGGVRENVICKRYM